jgi:hypothetical protein
MEAMNDGVSVLVGNGLSIAFNPDLNLRKITAEMAERIKGASDDGSDVIAAMKEIAARALPVGVPSDEDFEVLVGAFGSESLTMGYIERLAKLVSPKDKKLRAAIQRVSSFAEQVRDTGLSFVLEVIFERSRSSQEKAKGLQALVKAIVDAFPGRVTFGNLNYDTLLLSALLETCKSQLSDMGHGFKMVNVHTSGNPDTKVPSLRESAADFPANRRVRLLHLHGSLTFWSNRDKTIFAKLDTNFLASHDQWQSVRDQETNIRPVVVLANQKDKTSHVEEFPFSLAYELFCTSLTSTNHWLIIGYSFRDEPVNVRLRAEFAERSPKPVVLVVTRGDSPTRHEIERAFGWNVEDGDSSGWLSVHRGGANKLESSKRWHKFAG